MSTRALAVVTALLQCCHTVSHTMEEFRILSWNIRYDTPADGANAWPNRKRVIQIHSYVGHCCLWQMVSSAVRFLKADVLCAQEALAHQAALAQHSQLWFIWR